MANAIQIIGAMVAAIVLMTTLCCGVHAASISLVAPATVYANSTLSVDIIGMQMQTTAGVQCDLQYDQKVLKFVSISDGAFFSQGSNNSSIGVAQIPPVVGNGRVQNMISFRVAQPIAVSATDTIFTVVFTTLNAADTSIAVTNCFVSDGAGKPLPINTAGAVVHVVPVPKAPSAITTLHASRSTSGNILLQWQAPQTYNGLSAQGYEIRYTTNRLAPYQSMTILSQGACSRVTPHAPGTAERCVIAPTELQNVKKAQPVYFSMSAFTMAGSTKLWSTPSAVVRP